MNPAAAERFSSELPAPVLVHEASGPIAVGVLTIAAGAAVIGYVGSAWRGWLGSKLRGGGTPGDGPGRIGGQHCVAGASGRSIA